MRQDLRHGGHLRRTDIRAALKPALRPYEALELMKKEAITEFDVSLLNTFIRILGPHEGCLPQSQAAQG